jgi:hypothetical protein
MTSLFRELATSVNGALAAKINMVSRPAGAINAFCKAHALSQKEAANRRANDSTFAAMLMGEMHLLAESNMPIKSYNWLEKCSNPLEYTKFHSWT